MSNEEYLILFLMLSVAANGLASLGLLVVYYSIEKSLSALTMNYTLIEHKLRRIMVEGKESQE